MEEANLECFGSLYYLPAQIEHFPTRMFYVREAILSGREQVPFKLSQVLYKSSLLNPADFTTCLLSFCFAIILCTPFIIYLPT